jgi:agmatinase
VKAESVYLSNDIDGTDAAHADATGTPEPEGLDPEWLVTLIRRIGDEIGMLGGDIMEVAPPLQPTRHTTDLAARYLRETMNATLHAAL